MDYNSIRHWYESADLHDNPEDKFIALWISFNGYCTILSRSWQGTRMLEWVKNNSNFGERYEELLDNDFDRQAVEELKSLCPVHDMRPGLEHNSKTIADVEDFGEVMDVIYKIRCNLFHGSKDLANERDKKLAMLGYDVLMSIYKP
jgi:hypothetical protein